MIDDSMLLTELTVGQLKEIMKYGIFYNLAFAWILFELPNVLHYLVDGYKESKYYTMFKAFIRKKLKQT